MKYKLNDLAEKETQKFNFFIGKTNLPDQ